MLSNSSPLVPLFIRTHFASAPRSVVATSTDSASIGMRFSMLSMEVRHGGARSVDHRRAHDRHQDADAREVAVAGQGAGWLDPRHANARHLLRGEHPLVSRFTGGIDIERRLTAAEVAR